MALITGNTIFRVTVCVSSGSASMILPVVLVKERCGTWDVFWVDGSVSEFKCTGDMTAALVMEGSTFLHNVTGRVMPFAIATEPLDDTDAIEHLFDRVGTPPFIRRVLMCGET